MHVTILALAGRPTAWVKAATTQYLQRLPSGWRTTVELLPPARKQGAATLRQDDEWQRLARRLPAHCQLIVLDERGAAWHSRQLAKRLAAWQAQGDDVVFVIGGPDGVSDACRARADHVLSLSAMTLPHELARVVLVEQLYRAHSINERHPYHRD